MAVTGRGPHPDDVSPGGVFTAEQRARAAEYQRRLLANRRIGLAGQLVVLYILATLCSRNTFLDPVSRWPWVPSLIGVILVAEVVAALPGLAAEAWRELRLDRSYGLSVQTGTAWHLRAWRSVAVKVALDVLTGLALWTVIRYVSAWWFAAAWLVLAASWLLRAALLPLILPIGGTLRPLPSEVDRRHHQLAARMGIRAPRASVLDVAGRVAPNALVTGIGRFRRVYVLPGLLSLSPSEIDVVLAHELGHVRRRHVELLAVLVAALQVVVVLGLKIWVIRPPLYPARSIGALWYPDFALVALIASSLMGIVLFPFRRRQEARADLLALESTRDPAAFRSMIHVLASANLLRPEPRDSFRRTHPAPSRRLAFAERWARANGFPAPAGDGVPASPPLAWNRDGD